MKKAEFRFYEELNDFLPKEKKRVPFFHHFYGTPRIKDAIESLGVPHSQVDLILVNGNSVNFKYLLQNLDKVSVYPMFESIDITSITKLRPKPLRDIKFILDCHLGRLAKYLRMLGFDTLYTNPISDENLINISLLEHRLILTRDRGLLKSSKVQHGYWMRETIPQEQVVEVLSYFDLKNNVHPFTRCLECNSLLIPIEKEQLQIEEKSSILNRFENFNQCPECKRIYWEGSHFHNMQKKIKHFLSLS